MFTHISAFIFINGGHSKKCAASLFLQLICIFMMVSDVSITCFLLSTFFGLMTTQTFCPLLNWLSLSLFLSCRCSWYVSGTHPLSGRQFTHILYQPRSKISASHHWPYCCTWAFSYLAFIMLRKLIAQCSRWLLSMVSFLEISGVVVWRHFIFCVILCLWGKRIPSPMFGMSVTSVCLGGNMPIHAANVSSAL